MKGATQDSGIGPDMMGSMAAMIVATPELKVFMPEDINNPWSSILPSFEAIEVFINSKLINEQRRYEFLMAEFDAASKSDHPIAIAFIGRVHMYGVDDTMYERAMSKYDSKEVESAQNILNTWSMACFESMSDEAVAFRTYVVDMVATSYKQNLSESR